MFPFLVELLEAGMRPLGHFPDRDHALARAIQTWGRPLVVRVISEVEYGIECEERSALDRRARRIHAMFEADDEADEEDAA